MLNARYRRLSKSGRISSTPTHVYGVFVQSPAAGVGVTLYDDIAANSEHIIHEVASTEGSFANANYQPYLLTERGLYIAFGANVSECLVIFHIEGD